MLSIAVFSSPSSTSEFFLDSIEKPSFLAMNPFFQPVAINREESSQICNGEMSEAYAYKVNFR